MTSSPTGESLDFAEFVRLVLDALEAAHVKYLIGGAEAWQEVQEEAKRRRRGDG